MRELTREKTEVYGIESYDGHIFYVSKDTTLEQAREECQKYENTAEALKAINMYIKLKEKNRDTIDKKYIGKKVAISLGVIWNNKYDNVGYLYGTFEEYTERIKESIMKVYFE